MTSPTLGDELSWHIKHRGYIFLNADEEREGREVILGTAILERPKSVSLI